MHYEDTELYSGEKEYMIVKSDQKGLISKQESSKASIKDCDFVLVLSKDAAIQMTTQQNAAI